jgi:type IV pilus assembly protein PilF
MKKLVALSLIAVFCAVSIACTQTVTHSGKTLTSARTLSSAEKAQKKQEALELSIKLGLGYLREGNREGARLHMQKAIDADPRSAGANNGMALLYQLEKENALAEEHYLKALKFDPTFTAARNNYAIFLLRAGQNEKAYKELTRAASDLKYARRARVYLSLGQAAQRLGKTEEAIAAWEKSLNINPSMSPSYIELATVYFEKNDLPRAKRYLTRYEELTGPRARALWLAVRLEHAFGNKSGEASKALALEKMFPYSQQYLDYKQWLTDR